MTTEQVTEALSGTLWEVNPETYQQIKSWLNEGFANADHGQPLQHSGTATGNPPVGVFDLPAVPNSD